jgi:hypothetical protein
MVWWSSARVVNREWRACSAMQGRAWAAAARAHASMEQWPLASAPALPPPCMHVRCFATYFICRGSGHARARVNLETRAVSVCPHSRTLLYVGRAQMDKAITTQPRRSTRIQDFSRCACSIRRSGDGIRIMQTCRAGLHRRRRRDKTTFSAGKCAVQDNSHMQWCIMGHADYKKSDNKI